MTGRSVPPPGTLADAEPSRRNRLGAVLLCAALGIASLAMLPWAAVPIQPMPGFIPVSQTALVVVYALTTWVFLAQFRQSRSVPVLVLGAGSLYTTLIVLLQLVCSPNVFAPGLLLGQGSATLTWLWVFWHLGPPLFALPYACIEGEHRLRLVPPGRVALAGVAGSCGILAVVGLIALLAIRHVQLLPEQVEGDSYWKLTTSGVGPILQAMTLLSLGMLCWTTRLRSLLQLWLGVSLFLLVLDNLVTDLGAARATVGWMAGRIEALLAALALLWVYMTQFNLLQQQAQHAAAESERARTEAQAARDNLAIALEASGMGDWALDLRTDTAQRAPQHAEIFGYADPLPRWGWATFLEHVLPEDRPAAEAAFAHALAEGDLDLECRVRRVADGAERWLAIRGRVYRDGAGQPVTMAGCVMDTTERNRAEERLRQSEKMEALGQLTGGVAHDFNNLLTIIMGGLDIIVSTPADAERVARMARSGLQAAQRGAELTHKLLAFSRRQVLQPQTVNANRLLDEFQPLLRRAVGETVAVELELDALLDPVHLDPAQFEAAVLNLAVNARDAMPDGGTLRVQTRTADLASAPPGLPELVPGRYLCIAVADTGTGMDAQTAARAFEPFFTTKEIGKGTGLGLSQVYGFAKGAGGHVRIRTAPGEGCVVEMYLPPSAEPSTQGADRGCIAPLRRAAAGEVVLVVEDEEAVRVMAAESLEALGYHVLTAGDAVAALDRLRGTERVDILFSDVVMPGGMNGAQLAVEARRLRPDLKVLLTSGYTADALKGEQDLPSGFPLLPKPYLREELASRLQLVLCA